MKTRKITLFAIASILGAIALTGCGSIAESPENAPQTKPAAEQTVNAESLSSTAQSGAVAQSLSYDASSNTVTDKAEAGTAQSTPSANQAASSIEQAAAKNAVAYAGGNGYKIISTEAVKTSDGSAAYRFGIVPADNSKAPAWYYIAGENFAMTEGEWINQKDELTKEEWDHYQDSAEHRFAMASQDAGQNAIAASGISDAIITSCDFVNYDYDKLRYEFKVGIRSESDKSGKIQYFMAGSDYAVKFEDWGK